jgi:hypothetical protein
VTNNPASCAAWTACICASLFTPPLKPKAPRNLVLALYHNQQNRATAAKTLTFDVQIMHILCARYVLGDAISGAIRKL